MKILRLIFLIFLSPLCCINLFSQSQKSANMRIINANKLQAIYGFSEQVPVFKNKSVREIVSLLKDWNVNAIFGGYENADFVEQLHQVGIKVFVEISFFVGEKWWQEFSTSRPVMDEGKLLEKEDWYAGVNPTNPDVFQAVLNKIEKIINTNGVDGIWLDFFRWPCHWESPDPNLYQTSFDDRTIDLFLKQKQIILPDHFQNSVERNQWILRNKLELWTEFKCDKIVELAEKVNKFVKSKKSDILIGLFHVPWMNDDFDGAMRKIVGQDLARLSPYIDIFSPMVYHVMCGRSPQWIGEIVKYTYHKTSKPVLPIIQSMDVPREISPNEFVESLNSGISATGSAGIIVFNIKGMNEAKLIKMIELFQKN